MTPQKQPQSGRCYVCACTDFDCRQCVERTGKPCSWANDEHTLCTACVPKVKQLLREMQQKLLKGGGC